MRTFISIFSLFCFIIASVPVVDAQENNKVSGQVFNIVEEMPEYPGGEKALRSFIATNIKYPVPAQEKGIQGVVYVKFIVDTDGSVIESGIARGVDPILDNEALRVVHLLPKWKPGKQKGEAVKVNYTIPVSFVLAGDKESEAKEPDEAQVYFVVEEMPEYPGGEEGLRHAITSQLRYPVEALKENIQGRVYVAFVVDTDGSVTDAKVMRGVHPLLDAEAIRIVNTLTKWKPGTQRGKAVRVSYTVPIQFAIARDEK